MAINFTCSSVGQPRSSNSFCDASPSPSNAAQSITLTPKMGIFQNLYKLMKKKLLGTVNLRPFFKKEIHRK
jgi:hypothetical protein